MEQAASQATAQLQQKQRTLIYKTQQVVSYFQEKAQKLGEVIRIYVNRYPPLAAFIFTLLAFSALPISIFVLFAAVTVAATLSVALVGFAIVEGAMLFTGAGVLLAVLGGVTLVTGIVFSWLFGIYLSYRGITMLYCNISGGAWSLTESVRGLTEKSKQAATSAAQTSGMQPR